MRRVCVLLLVVAACDFGSPSGTPPDGAPEPEDAMPDAAAPRCDLAGTWEAGKQPTKMVHVSKVPGPGTPDGSQTNPFTTIGDAIPAIVPGTRVLLGPGDYAGADITDVRGTADAPIWIEGPASGQPARIVGPSGAGLHLAGAQYWVIRNLEASGLTGRPGISVDDGAPPVAGSAHHIVIESVRVASVSGSCIELAGVTDVAIRDSTLASCDHGVMMIGVQHAVVARNSIASIFTAGVALRAGSADIDVRQNVIANVENGIAVWLGGSSIATEFRPALTAIQGNTEAADIRAFDNVIRDVRYAVQCSICSSALVAHNLMRRVTDHVLVLHQPYTSLGGFLFAPAGAVAFANNAIEVGGSAEAVEDRGSGTEPGTCTFRHNLWLRDGGVWVPALTTAEMMGIYGQPSGYSDAGRLCAGSGSRAAGAGTPLTEVTGTLKGECRPSPPSIGPSEPDPGC